MAVAMPLWKPTLSVTETAFLHVTDRAVGDLERFWLVPEDLDVSAVGALFPNWQVKRFAREHFTNVRSYSWWMTSREPYRAFEKFEFLTVCQTDAVLLKSPSGIDTSDADYIGSVWDPPLKTLALGTRVYVARSGVSEGWLPVRLLGRRRWVGNGGLSTRRVEAFVRAGARLEQRRYTNAREHIHEDALYSALRERLALRFADPRRCDAIYRERTMRGLATIPDIYGVHAVEKWNSAVFRQVVESAC